MALSDLAVYSEYAYAAMTEVLAQQVELFNAASAGAITLAPAAMQGDYSDVAFWQKISGLVRRRNAYGSGAVSEKVLEHLVDTMVKVAAGTPPIRLDPGQFRWIQMNPEQAGAALGQQMAIDSLADMLNIALGAARVALENEGTNVFDATGLTSKTASFIYLNSAHAKMGDASQQLVAWVMHSTPLFSLYGNALTNAEHLFNYGSVNVVRDPWGRVFIATDCANLTSFSSPNTTYRTLGLVRGAINVGQNNDFDANEEGKNGDENIIRTYQAEWSYNLGIKGFAWDKTNGGKSPNDAAILTGTNWDKYATSAKDIAGVLLKTLNG
jgi:hypothetical protein